MKQVIVENFGGPEVLKVVELPTPAPGPAPAPGLVRVRITSIGMNHADLMARAGQYRLSSGDPPFVPGLEAGGVIDAVGPGVTTRQVGQRVILGADVPRRAAQKAAPGTPGSGPGSAASGATTGGTYRSHYVCPADRTIPAPDAIPDDQLGALWLPYLTAWGCLVWKQQLQRGAWVGLPAASSSVALAAAQIVRAQGAFSIGLTTSARKVDALRAMPEAAFDHLVVTREPASAPGTAAGKPADRKWNGDIRKVTQDHGMDVFMDPVAAGEYLNTEIKCLAQGGTIWVYGLLGAAGVVDVTPLIRKSAAIRGWALNELVAAGDAALQEGYRYILDGFARGTFRQRVDRVFRLDDVRAAHEFMARGEHVGKLVLVP